MSLSNSNVNNFLNKAKGKIYSFISNIKYSPYDSNLNINSSLYKPKTLSKVKTIDLYRSDYIPIKKTNNNLMLNFDKSFLGKKKFLSNDNNNNINNDNNNNKQERKINIPNDKRYHKSLLENSLEKIKSEIRQKREDNILRMNQLNEKKDELNNYFQDKNNNKGKFIGIFNNNKNINETINLEESDNLIKNNIKSGFNTDYICEDINESFSINSNNNKKKKLNEKNIIIQRQTDFMFNTNNIISEKPKENNFGFVNKVAPLKEEKKENKNKIIFGAPKECVLSKPLKDNPKFGFVKTEPQKPKEDNKIKDNNNKINVIFGAPKDNEIKYNNKNNIFLTKTEEKKEDTKEKADNNNSLFGNNNNNNLFNNNKEEKSNNIFLNQIGKESKLVTINAVDTSKTIFGKNNDKKDNLFGDIGIFGKPENNLNKNENKPSLFGSSNLFNINNNGNRSLFDISIDNNNNNKTSLFGSALDKDTNNDNNKKSLFGNSTDKDSNNNKTSLFGNSTDKDAINTKTSLFGECLR